MKYFLKALYGKKTQRKTTVFGSNSVPLNEIDTDVNEIENDSPLCSDPKIGAIVTMEDNSTYVFKGKQYYKLTDDSVEDGYPRDIARDWDGLPGKSCQILVRFSLNSRQILVRFSSDSRQILVRFS